MSLQNFKNRTAPVSISPKVNMLSCILINFGEEFVEIFSQFGGRKAVILGRIFLLKDESIPAGSEDLPSRPVKLHDEGLWTR
jgi:hypothetical protein